MENDTHGIFENSLLLGYAATDKLGVFGEYFAQYPFDGAARHNLDLGATYLLTDNLQIDGAVGVGLNDAANDVFFTTGVSFRF